MKKYIVTLANMPQNQIACINNHIAVGSLSENGNRDYIDSDTIMRIFIREGV